MLRGPIRFTNALAGTVDFIYPGPAIDMQSPASAGAADGATYVYYAQSFDMSEWEIGSSVYTAGSGTFARTTIIANHLGTTAKVNFTNPPQVLVLDTATAFTTAADVAAMIAATSGVIDSATAILTAVTVITNTGPIPIDDTIPQNTEGSFLMQVSITPKSITSKLRCRFSCSITPVSADNPTFAMFSDGDVNAKIARYYSTPAGFAQLAYLECEFIAGTTSPVVISVRASGQVGNMTINGSSGARIFGGSQEAVLIVEEIS